MAQGEVGYGGDVRVFYRHGAAPGGMRSSGAQPDQVGAQAIDASLVAARGDGLKGRIIQGNAGQALTGLGATFAQPRLIRLPVGDECRGITIEGQSPTQDLSAFTRRRPAV